MFSGMVLSSRFDYPLRNVVPASLEVGTASTPRSRVRALVACIVWISCLGLFSLLLRRNISMLNGYIRRFYGVTSGSSDYFFFFVRAPSYAVSKGISQNSSAI
jgi:hypothetical protein